MCSVTGTIFWGIVDGADLSCKRCSSGGKRTTFFSRDAGESSKETVSLVLVLLRGGVLLTNGGGRRKALPRDFADVAAKALDEVGGKGALSADIALPTILWATALASRARRGSAPATALWAASPPAGLASRGCGRRSASSLTTSGCATSSSLASFATCVTGEPNRSREAAQQRAVAGANEATTQRRAASAETQGGDAGSTTGKVLQAARALGVTEDPAETRKIVGDLTGETALGESTTHALCNTFPLGGSGLCEE